MLVVKHLWAYQKTSNVVDTQLPLEDHRMCLQHLQPIKFHEKFQCWYGYEYFHHRDHVAAYFKINADDVMGLLLTQWAQLMVPVN